MRQDKPCRHGRQGPDIVMHSEPAAPPCESSSATRTSSSASSRAPSSSRRLLFVEVRGPRGRRRQGLLYDRSARELKSHVMLNANEGKRRLQAGDKNDDRDSLILRSTTRLSPEPSPQHVDPFNMLPVDETPELHAAIRFYFENYPGPTPLTDDVLVCHKNAYEREKMQWSRVQFSFVQGDRISYYLMLFIWQVMKNLSQEINVDTAKYWAKVLQLTRQDMPIGKTGTEIPESYVAMIAGLAVAETWLGNFANSEQHRKAMHSLVTARGGLSSFCSMAQRALKWCEYYACAALGVRPELPRLPAQPLSLSVVKLADAAHRRTLALLPRQIATSELSLIFFQLHVAALGPAIVPRAPLANVLDDVEHRLLDALIGQKERFVALGVPGPVDVVYCALLQAAHMWVYAIMSCAPKEMPLHVLFVATLREILRFPALVDAWRAVASAESLLWVLFVGWAAASQLRGDAGDAIAHAKWLMLRCFDVFEVLELSAEQGLRGALMKFPWSADPYEERCKVLWSIFVDRDDLNIT